MAVALKLLIDRTEAALAAATDAKKKLRLERDLASFKLTALRAEGGDDDGDGDDDEDEDDDKASKAAKRAEMSKKKATAAKHKAKADEHRQKAAEYDEEARKCMGDEDDEEDAEAKALRAELNARLAHTGSGGAIAALADRAAMNTDALERVAKLERDAAAKEMRASIHEAVTGRRILRKQAAMLAEKDPGFVRDYLAMHPNPMVHSDDSELIQPTIRENADIGTAAMTDIDKIVAGLPASLTDEQRAKVKQDMINGRRAVAAKNGTAGPGRY